MINDYETPEDRVIIDRIDKLKRRVELQRIVTALKENPDVWLILVGIFGEALDPEIATMNLRHSLCGREVSLAVLNDDVAIYVWCEHCHDMVEDGELVPDVDETKVRLHVDQHRVRPFMPELEKMIETILKISIVAVIPLTWLVIHVARDMHDDKIDELINANTAKYRPGMEEKDRKVLDKLGDRTWHTALRAQRRLEAQKSEEIS